MFLGANNAFYPEAGKGTDVLSGESGLTISQVARRYKAKGIGSIVVGGENYGEGSSREHAAMSPRYLGVKVVLVGSFARIHEINLKKQGILPLTFAAPSEYDLVDADDRVSVTGLATLRPEQPVTVILKKKDGRTVSIRAQHSLTQEQIGWFKAGSALNAVQGESR
jgi:aconitate hydratase